jgi:hypothetical protein
MNKKELKELEELEKEFEKAINGKTTNKKVNYKQIVDKINEEYEKELVEFEKKLRKKEIKKILKNIKKQEKEIKKQEKKLYNKRVQLGLEKDNKIDSKTIIISKDRNSNFDFRTHAIQLNKMKQKYKNRNVIYSQKVEYYIDNKLIDELELQTGKDEYATFDFSPNETSMRMITDEKIQSIVFKNTIGGSDGVWKPRALLRKKKGYTKIITSVYPQMKLNNKFNKNQQVYKDNNNNTCLIDGCIQYFEQIKENCKNAKATYNKLKNNYDDYKNGIPESEIKNFCDKFGFSIDIINLVDGTRKNFSTSDFKRFRIEFLNTRYNHVDLLTHNYNEALIVSKDEYEKIKENKPFYIEKYGVLYTLNQSYKIMESDYTTISNEFKKDIKFETLFIRENTPSYNLIKTYNYNVHTFFNIDMEIKNDLYIEIDAKKAFYNYSDKNYNKYYRGVPSGSLITYKCKDDFNIDVYNEFEIIGFFQVKIIDIIDKKDHMMKFGFFIGSIHTLSTSNIDLLQKYLKFKFIYICAGPSVHIPFTEKFLDNFDLKTGQRLDKNDNKTPSIKGYCKFYGSLLCERSPDIKIKPLKDDIRYYDLINHENYEMYQGYDNIITVYDKNSIQYSYIHINYSIHAYTMTLLLEQMLKFDVGDIIGVKLDSIVLKNNKLYNFDENIFKLKNAKIEKMFGDNKTYNKFNSIHSYFSSLKINYDSNDDLNINDIWTPHNEYFKKRIILFNGAGGTGKTHTLLNNLNQKEILFTSIGWKLINGKKEEFNKIIGLSIPKITGEADNIKCEKIKNNSARYIIIDEATLIKKDYIDKIISLYPQCFIFILGDIDDDDFYYQCSITDDIFKPSKNLNCQCIKFSKTYRFDEELNNKISDLRIFMRENYENLFNRKDLYNYVKKEFSMCFKNKEDVIFNDCDIGISEYDDYKKDNELSLYFISKGTSPKYFIKNTNIKTGQIRGQQLENKPDHKNYEMKLFSTIHSFQGLQLNHDNKIIISIKNNFDYNLLYTAISRARRLDQIIFIK